MAQVLTSLIPNFNKVAIPVNNGMSQTTPAAKPQTFVTPANYNNPLPTSVTINPITTQTPTSIIPPTKTIIPVATSQKIVSAPISPVTPSSTVNLSGFTPAQLAAFQNAANLGSGVKTNLGIVGGANPTANIAPTAPVTTPVIATQATTSPVATSTTGNTSTTTSTTPPTFSGLLGAIQSLSNSATSNPTVQHGIQLLNNAANQVGPALEVATNQPGLEGAFNEGVANVQNAFANATQGAQNLITGALTPTETALGGVETAAGLAAPSGNYPFVFNPVTGQFSTATGGSIGGLSGNYNNDVSSMVTAVMGGKIGIDQATQALQSMYGNTAQGALYTAITNAGGNPTALQSQAQALQSNILAGGTAQTTAANTIYQNAQSAAAGFITALNNINQNANNLFTTMRNTPGINPTDIKFLNTPINKLSTQFNSPAYANFNAQIAALQRSVSNYLNQGEIPSSATASAQQIIDGSMTVGALQGAVQGINADMLAAAQSQITTAQTQVNQLAQNATGTAGTSTNTQDAFSDAGFYGTGS